MHDQQQRAARDFADPPTNLHEYGADVIPGEKHVLDIDRQVATVYAKDLPDDEYISSDVFVTFDGSDEIQFDMP